MLRNSIARIGGGLRRRRTGRRSRNINAARGHAEGRVARTITHTLSEYRGFADMRAGKTASPLKRSTRPRDLRIPALATQTLQATGDPGGAERLILRRQYEVALGSTPTPSLVDRLGGTLVAGTWSVIAVALSLQAYPRDVVGANNGAIGQSSPLRRRRCRVRLLAPMRTERLTHFTVVRQKFIAATVDDRIDF